MGNRAHGLADLLADVLLPPLEVDNLRKRLAAEGRLDQQTEYTLAQLDRRKKEMETLCRGEADFKKFHRLVAEIEDLSDEIRDCVRDKKVDQLTQRHWSELEKRWELLRKYVD